METFSYTKLKVFEQCKLKYKFKYIDKVEPDFVETMESFLGSIIHNVIEKMHIDKKYGKIPSLNDIISYYKDIWKRNFNKNIVFIKKGYTEKNYMYRGEEMIKKYYKRFLIDKNKTVGMEYRMNIKIGDIVFTGIIDRISVDENGNIYVHDFKTWSSLPEMESIESDYQLLMYSFFIKKKFPYMKNVFAVWHILEFNQDIEMLVTKTMIDRAIRRIKNIVKSIKKEEKFEAKPSKLCYWCEFRHVCGEIKHIIEVEEKREKRAMNILKLANKYVELKRKMEKIMEVIEDVKKEIINVAEKNGYRCIRGSDFILTISTKERLRMRNGVENILKSILIKNGIYNNVSKIDQKKFIEMLKNGVIHLNIDRFFDKEVVKNLRIRKVSNIE